MPEKIVRPSLDEIYMKLAGVIATRSSCRRKKVGTVIVKDNNIISFGYNGTPSGWHTNACECNGKTKDIVLHAESNAITKLSKNGGRGAKGATAYCTLQPCIECAKLIVQSGIKRVVYKEPYRFDEPITFMEQCGIDVVHYGAKQNSLRNQITKKAKTLWTQVKNKLPKNLITLFG